ncbi:MFS transporter [Austwickia sp. TVS 96-490-7B]|uniref:MFS transporter n=1 Tax=Austwickia sp. TVS 96-490-7B TaxID=2830843 RepID=UPI0021073C55|nr:MFS transporter [Austwickia sp. TVS 96-490-7B]
MQVPRVRLTLLLGVMVRVPAAAGGIILTLHVVGMGRSYGEAGLAAMIMTIGLAVAGPWRGRLLDRRGLRRVVWPSLVVLAGCWVAAPQLAYLPLLGVCALAGLFTIPSFSIIRQAVIVAVPDHDRRTALALDAVAVEVAFMVGPLAGVWAASTWDTGLVLAGVGLCGVAAGAVLWLVDPPMREESDGTTAESGGAEEVAVGPGVWLTPAVAAVFLAAVGATVVLAGTDLTVVAVMREFGATSHVGVVMAMWCVGSVVGGLVYGAWTRPVSSLWLLLGLGAATAPLVLARDVWTLTALMVISGVWCAPTITAMVDELSRVVPERNRGEVMGWHGSCMQVGSAAGAPLAGAVVDTGGASAGFGAVAVVGMVLAVVGLIVGCRRRRGDAAATL